MTNKNELLNIQSFFYKVLTATATGIVIGLIPNAILGIIFKKLSSFIPTFLIFYNIVNTMQFIVPVLIGVLVGIQFNLSGMSSALIGATVFLSSGAFIITDTGIKLIGTGDLLNIILISSISIIIIKLLEGKLGTLTILLLPIIMSIGVGGLGVFLLPYMQQITISIGLIIEKITTLQPLLMCILLSISFGLLVISPISAVAIGIAIGISGLGAGAAAIGITACTAVLVIGSCQINKSGVTLSILFGAMKLMMPNLIKYPIIILPIIINASLCGIISWFLGISGVSKSAGFGLVGFVGPMAALNGFNENDIQISLLKVILAFIIFPFINAILIDLVLRKIFKVYNKEIFKYNIK